MKLLRNTNEKKQQGFFACFTHEYYILILQKQREQKIKKDLTFGARKETQS